MPFLSRPVVRIERDSHDFVVLVEPLVYLANDGEMITIQSGLRCDGASVPHWASIFACPWNRALAPGLLHDHGYRVGGERERWDALFYEALLAEGAEHDDARRMWEAVRLFGGTAWQRHRAAERVRALLAASRT